MFANPTAQANLGEDQPSVLDTDNKEEVISSDDEADEDERMQDEEEEELITVPKDEKE